MLKLHVDHSRRCCVSIQSVVCSGSDADNYHQRIRVQGPTLLAPSTHTIRVALSTTTIYERKYAAYCAKRIDVVHPAMVGGVVSAWR